jgi:hypothetical protein
MMKIAPSVATVPIGTSFAHGDVNSRPSSSAHASSVALARHNDPSAGGEKKHEKKGKTHPAELKPKAEHALVRTRPTR